jgi:hypothetical protein
LAAAAVSLKSRRENCGRNELARIENGKLIAAAAAATFVLLLTVDGNIKSQQNLSSLPIKIAVLVAVSNRRKDLVPLIPVFEEAIVMTKPWRLIEIRLTGVTLVV